MSTDSPPIRLIPMDQEEMRLEGCRTIAEVQSKFFRQTLPRKRGQYDYRSRGLVAPVNTLVLFQFDKHIIASARFLDREKAAEGTVDEHKKEVGGVLHFDVESIRTFDPLNLQAIREIWPTFEFLRTMQKLDAGALGEFEDRLQNVEKAYDDPPVIHDLEGPPPGLARTTTTRILRDTAESKWVKQQHKECQFLSCSHPVKLPNGTHYVEGHHIKPLGGEHRGPDDRENILCLCPNHHAECDLGVVLLRRSDLRQVPDHDISDEYIDYHNDRIYCGE